jgi:hypothetical protein
MSRKNLVANLVDAKDEVLRLLGRSRPPIEEGAE